MFLEGLKNNGGFRQFQSKDSPAQCLALECDGTANGGSYDADKAMVGASALQG